MKQLVIWILMYGVGVWLVYSERVRHWVIEKYIKLKMKFIF